MTTKTLIINRFISTFSQSTIVNLSNVVRKFVLLDDINDFPYVCVFAPRERREHNLGGEKIGILEVVVRGHVNLESHDGETIETLDKAEELGVEIESMLNLFLSGNCENGVFDARIISLRTDEGLFEPYGIVDINIEIYYLIPAVINNIPYVAAGYVLDGYVSP